MKTACDVSTPKSAQRKVAGSVKDPQSSQARNGFVAAAGQPPAEASHSNDLLFPAVTPDYVPNFLVVSAAAGDTPCLWGGSGVGKSETLLEAGRYAPLKKVLWALWSKETGQPVPAVLPDLPVTQYLLTNLDPEVLLGLPYYHVLDEKTNDRTTRQAVPEALRLQMPSILLLDEFSAAKQEMQKAIYQIVNERRIFNIPLPPGTLVVLAGNTAKDQAAVRKTLFPLGNRCQHRTFVPTADAWVKWAVKQNLWAPFISYVQARGLDAILGYNPADPSPAQLTPRSYFKGANRYTVVRNGMQDLLGDLEIDLPDTELEASIQGAVGKGAAIEILAWLKAFEAMPTWEEILANPKKAALPEEGRPDLAYLVAAMALERFRDASMAAEGFMALATYLERFIVAQPQATDAIGYALASYVRGGAPSKLALQALQENKVLAAKVFTLMTATLNANKGRKSHAA